MHKDGNISPGKGKEKRKRKTNSYKDRVPHAKTV